MQKPGAPSLICAAALLCLGGKMRKRCLALLMAGLFTLSAVPGAAARTPDAWAASPFRDQTPPTSFSEMLDFMEVYLDTPHEGFLFYCANGGSRLGFLNDLFVRPLMTSWVVQCRYAGLPVVFSDPQFIALAGRACRGISTPPGNGRTAFSAWIRPCSPA